MEFIRYPHLDPVKRLKNEGRELLGKAIYLTVKRDGSNVSVWLDDNDVPHISSHNLEEADSTLQFHLKSIKVWPKIVAFLQDTKNLWNDDIIVYGELITPGHTPTRIEPPHKKASWILFDIYSKKHGFYNYLEMHIAAYGYRIPVVPSVKMVQPKSIEDLNNIIKDAMKWCRRHRREGVVGKAYDVVYSSEDKLHLPDKYDGHSVFFKEKVNIPKLPKIERQPTVELPKMPQETILRALQHSYDELLSQPHPMILGIERELWKDKAKVMPLISKHLQLEAKEHSYSTPRNFYQIYLDTPFESIAPQKA